MKLAACFFSLCLFAAGAALADGPASPPAAKDCRLVISPPEADETVSWDGPCEDGYAHGNGVVQWLAGDKLKAQYKGPMERGRMHGAGAYQYANEKQYWGEFKNGQRDGQGIEVDKYGNRYEGAWKENRYDGVGGRVFSTGGRYDGEWKQGKFHGHGVIVYAGNVSRYEGEFKDGLRLDESPGAPLPKEHFSIRRSGAMLNSNNTLATSTMAPFDKAYADLTPEQQRRYKSYYPLLADGDEPPYPLKGIGTLTRAMHELQRKLKMEGSVTLYATVDSEGKATSVSMMGDLGPEAKKIAAMLMMVEKYKPARCSGQACEMVFQMAFNFSYK
ncbi:hypothetical protein [Janthinobacterium fluminis]|uniref:MORN repeat protein n=1 Tax=Janthinobacterium fluminis TaxID=2987524 RepID=A0ABT5K0V8_9BURK|nr:hypothetical protein [Janthinobacterium fluminis]MDC8758095.1 hypothetical protein [Janthinobacterium fluminis]